MLGNMATVYNLELEEVRSLSEKVKLYRFLEVEDRPVYTKDSECSCRLLRNDHEKISKILALRVCKCTAFIYSIPSCNIAFV